MKEAMTIKAYQAPRVSIPPIRTTSLGGPNFMLSFMRHGSLVFNSLTWDGYWRMVVYAGPRNIDNMKCRFVVGFMEKDAEGVTDEVIYSSELKVVKGQLAPAGVLEFAFGMASRRVSRRLTDCGVETMKVLEAEAELVGPAPNALATLPALSSLPNNFIYVLKFNSKRRTCTLLAEYASDDFADDYGLTDNIKDTAYLVSTGRSGIVIALRGAARRKGLVPHGPYLVRKGESKCRKKPKTTK